jgi:succinoglycan biosynthesis transport protein ExoP
MTTVTRLPLPGADTAQESVPSFGGVADSALDLRRILAILRRRKVMILGVMVVITSLAVLIVNQVTPLYRADARVVVEKSRQTVAPIQAVVQGLNPDWYTTDTEAAVMGSRELAAKAVDRLNLVNSPLFNPDLRPPHRGLFSAVTGPIRDFIHDNVTGPIRDALLGPGQSAAPAGPVLSPEEKRRQLVQGVIDAYLGGLSVVTGERSRVITIQYVSTDPRMAALAANTTAELYILDQLTSRGETTSRAAEWLSQRVNELRQRVIDSEQRLEAYRRKSGIVALGGASIYQQQLARFNEELVLARTKLAESEARNQQVQEQLKAGSFDTAAAVLDNKLIQNLREQETTLVRKLAELKTQYREGHPQVRLAEQELASLRTKISTETQKIAAYLGNELALARVRVQNLDKAVTDLQDKLQKQNEAEVNIRSLESEVKANKQLYETLLSRLKETDVQTDTSLQQADARIISRATVPGGPFYPRKNMMVLAALVVSAVVGMALALVADFLDSGFRSLGQIETMTGLPTLALVPSLKDGDRHGKRPHEIAVERPNSGYGEAIRTIRTGLLLTHIDRPPRTVLVTSSVPGEGKTSVALSVACSAARSAQKSIVIDCDLRHSNLHNYLEYPNKIGLTDYLAGQASLEDVVEIDPRSGVHFITAGSRAPNPADLLGSQEMKKLLTRLASLYDLVVLDSPPLLPVSDGLVLVRMVDKAIFLVRWEKTKRETALTGLKMLMEAGADLAGIALTQVDVRKHAQYDYSDSGYYYSSSYKNYYIE